ncbi:MAG: helical backbone metal receptor [Dehalogenimonas sp.]
MSGTRMLLTDEAGRQIWVNVPAGRVVSLAPSNTEIIYAIGAEGCLVGVTEYCDYPEEAKSKTVVGGYSTINCAKIAELKPDLILGSGIHQKMCLHDLEQIDCPVLILDSSDITGMLKTIRLIGLCTEKERASETLTSALKMRLGSISEKLKSIPKKDRPRVYFLHESQTWKTFGAKTIGDTLCDLAGGYNLGRDFGEYYPYPSLENIVKSDPDVIIAETGYGSDPTSPTKIALSEPSLKNTKARKNHRVYGLDSSLISRAGPRMIDGLEALAQLLHPEIFFETAGYSSVH